MIVNSKDILLLISSASSLPLIDVNGEVFYIDRIEQESKSPGQPPLMIMHIGERYK